MVYTDMKGLFTGKYCSSAYAMMPVNHRIITPEKNVLDFSENEMHGNSENQKVSRFQQHDFRRTVEVSLHFFRGGPVHQTSSGAIDSLPPWLNVKCENKVKIIAFLCLWRGAIGQSGRGKKYTAEGPTRDFRSS